MSQSLVRWSGLAAMVGSVLWVLWAGGQLQGFGGPSAYLFFNRLLPFVLLPVVLGFIGLHAAQRKSYGRLGVVGFVTVLVGFTLIIAGSGAEFWVFSDQPYGLPNGRNASWNLFLLGHPVLAVGTLLFGIATVRAGVFSRDVAVLFAVLGVGVVVPFIGAFIFAIPLVWLGYPLWSGSVRQSSRVT
jgi:hypothetical protein